MLQTGLRHFPVASIPLLLSPNSSIILPPLRVRELGAIIILILSILVPERIQALDSTPELCQFRDDLVHDIDAEAPPVVQEVPQRLLQAFLGQVPTRVLVLAHVGRLVLVVHLGKQK